MIEIFFDMQGNAQIADSYLISVAADQPASFGLDMISEDDYNNKILKGYKYINGEFIKPKSPEEMELTPAQQLSLLKKEYNDQIDHFKELLTMALLNGDESTIKKIQADYKDFKEEYNTFNAGDSDE